MTDRVPVLQHLKTTLFVALGRPDGALGIHLAGHRRYVGGRWDELGRLQFEFMKSRGLRPDRVFLDIGCGALRGGVHFIPYLERGHYLGLEKEQSLIDAGIENELGDELIREKAPEFVVSSSFDFTRFSKRPDVALAQSLFTHLTPEDIAVCLTKLRAAVDTGVRFYATYFLRETLDRRPVSRSHAHRVFFYSQASVERLGQGAGWRLRGVDEWGHPSGQMMAEYVAA
jgi:SAM-dependent methyltransferase